MATLGPPRGLVPEALEADAARVEGRGCLEVVLPVHLELQHGRQRLSAHDTLHGGALQSDEHVYITKEDIENRMLNNSVWGVARV